MAEDSTVAGGELLFFLKNSDQTSVNVNQALSLLRVIFLTYANKGIPENDGLQIERDIY